MFEAITACWAEVQASNIPERGACIAPEIAAAEPDLVGLQEIAQWSTGSFGAMNIRYDFLASILHSLRDQGATYVPIAVKRDLIQAAPPDSTGSLLQFIDRHAVLMRIGHDFGRIQPYDTQAEVFSALHQTASPVGGLLSVARSWIAIDATVGDRKFRLIETHVESLDEAVQLAQAKELVAGPANTSLPVIMMGDFNSNANRQLGIKDYTPTYPELVAAGFKDVWATLNPDDPGNICCHARDLRNTTSALDRRLDLFLTRGPIEPLSAALVGDHASSRAPLDLCKGTDRMIVRGQLADSCFAAVEGPHLKMPRSATKIA